MSVFSEKICVNNFSIGDMDVSEIDRLEDFLPKSGVIDINIAERGLIFTLEGQNICQERIAQVERWIGLMETNKNRAWSNAALNKAPLASIKTAKEKDWFAQSDDDYVEAYNQLVLAKACKKWLENKAGYFNSWHYAFKTFLKRDYSLENSASSTGIFPQEAYNEGESIGVSTTNANESICGEIDWE
jgi:hypothetical protein